MIVRGFSDLISGGAGPKTAAQKRTEVPVGGELKKDPVCGTFVPASTTNKLTVGGETVYFCSPECRNKYRA